jgi:hypothetical protein
MDFAAAPTPMADVREARPEGAMRPPRGEPPSIATTAPATSDDVGDLTARLAVLERDLRRTWAALVERDASLAGRVGHAGRLVHRAATILEPGTIY